MPWCCIYNNVITCFPNAARRAQFAVTFRWLSSLSCRIISHVRVDDRFNRAAPSIEINPTLFEARNTSRYNHACQSQRCCRGHEGINRTGITRAMALNARKNNKSNVPVILEAFIKLSIEAGNFRALSNVNETFTFESRLLLVRQVGENYFEELMLIFFPSIFWQLRVMNDYFLFHSLRSARYRVHFWGKSGRYYFVFNTSGEKSGYVPSFFPLRDFPFTVASFRASLSLSAQYFALGDKGAREIIVSAYRSIPIKYLPCGNRKRWRYVASEDPRRESRSISMRRETG